MSAAQRQAPLRRLLNLGDPVPTPPAPSLSSPTRKSWNNQGVTLPHGTPVCMRYNRHTYEGKIVDGSWVIGDRSFDSPSGAASGVAVTKKGKHPRLDGWIYWQVKLPGEDSWKSLDSLRPKITLEELGLASGHNSDSTTSEEQNRFCMIRRRSDARGRTRRHAGSAFLQGDVTGFKATFDFAIHEDTFTKLVEGAYNNRGKPVQAGKAGLGARSLRRPPEPDCNTIDSEVVG